MFVVKYRAIFFLFSGLLVVGSIFALFKFGLNLGTDFTGGSILEVEYAGGRPEAALVREKVNALNLGDVSVQESGDLAYLLRSRDLTPEEHQVLLA
ncbi:MAG: protein translocase subunit SecF, partial [Patescibacteria group bacterium]